MIKGLLRYLPYLLILMPLIGFFVDVNASQWQARYPIQQIIRIPMVLPLWGKTISIIIGIVWILIRFNQNNSKK